MTESVARLRGEQLTLGYGKYTVAENLTVEIPDGHFTAIIGPNGCGKSTLLRTLSRLMTPAHGHVWLDGEQAIATRHRVFCVSVQTMRQLRMRSSPMYQMTLSRKWASFLYRLRRLLKMNT